YVLQRRLDRIAIGQRGEGTTKIVGDRQHVLGEALDAELALALDILLGTTAHVLRLGEGAQELVLRLGLLDSQLLELARTFGLARNVEVVVGRLDRHLRPGVARGWIAGHTLIPIPSGFFRRPSLRDDAGPGQPPACWVATPSDRLQRRVQPRAAHDD